MAPWLDWQGNALIRRPNGGSNPLGAMCCRRIVGLRYFGKVVRKGSEFDSHRQLMEHPIHEFIPNAGPVFISRVENKQCVVCGASVDFSHIAGLIDDLNGIPRVCGQEHSNVYQDNIDSIQTT